MTTIKIIYSACLITLIGLSCNTTSEQFSSIRADKAGIIFENTIPDNDTLNILNFEYIYNGGGVAIADFNNDSIQDVLLTGNIVDNAMYLGLGNWKYKDISTAANISPSNRWSTGVAVVDINLDGLQDLYITASGHKNTPVRSNQLLICQGINDDGIPTYKDESIAYGLADSSSSTNAAFFDYDNDGDLDLVVINNEMVIDRQASKYRDRSNDVQTRRTDLLFENNWNDELNHPVFTDVSVAAGLFQDGFSLGLNVHDFNRDGWKDILITNDYLSTDVLYINQQDGTFQNEASVYFKHTSFSAMGMDVVDLDNDGYSEVIALDMLPADNYRKKTMLPPNNYTSYLNNDKYNYQYQHVRNTLQKNNFNQNHVGKGATFSEQSLVSGVAATDWSWAPLVADFDNDGDRDMIITNGFPKDITDRDFIDYNQEVGAYASDGTLLPKMPSIKLLNVAYENLSGLNFKNVTKDWGIKEPTFSNGGAYADLDGDGDLDYIINNINGPVSIYENNNPSQHNAIRIKLIGATKNKDAIGATIKLYTDGNVQVHDLISSRGYLSSVETAAHFGIGQLSSADSVVVIWPDNTTSVHRDIQAGAITLAYDTVKRSPYEYPKPSLQPLVTDVSKEVGINFVHEESDYTDFNVQPMLLHKLSQYGPGVAVGDVNGDNLEDIYISGSHFNNGTFLLQQNDGTYIEEYLMIEPKNEDPGEELGALLIDMDGDNDKDLYIVYGGYEYDLDEPYYGDRIYQNNNGQFSLVTKATPINNHSGSVVTGYDYDQDGDIDLFIGGRVTPGSYPEPVSSYLLRNDSQSGIIKYTDVTTTVAPELINIGMVTDALWSDYDNDGDRDIIIAGEFMAITILQQEDGKFQNITSRTGLAEYRGWWNSLVSGDFDNDGDIDYIAGNYGNQTLTPVSNNHPISVYYKDFDNNGSKDLIPTCWYEDQDGVKAEYPYFGRLEHEKQVVKIKSKYRNHDSYARATIHEILSEEDRNNSLVLSANHMMSSFIRNNGDGTMDVIPLPAGVQLAPIYGMSVTDINQDGHLDVMMIGNEYGVEVSAGRMDAHDGIVLIGDGTGKFSYRHASQTGFYVQGDGKSLTTVYNASTKHHDIIALQNRGPMEVYNSNQESSFFKWEEGDSYIEITLSDGSIRRMERYMGSSYLSQQSEYVIIPTQAVKTEIYTNQGVMRRVEL